MRAGGHSSDSGYKSKSPAARHKDDGNSDDAQPKGKKRSHSDDPDEETKPNKKAKSYSTGKAAPHVIKPARKPAPLPRAMRARTMQHSSDADVEMSDTDEPKPRKGVAQKVTRPKFKRQELNDQRTRSSRPILESKAVSDLDREETEVVSEKDFIEPDPNYKGHHKSNTEAMRRSRLVSGMR
jgi:hypothetical protein